jgi:hypothetical protein
LRLGVNNQGPSLRRGADDTVRDGERIGWKALDQPVTDYDGISKLLFNLEVFRERHIALKEARLPGLKQRYSEILSESSDVRDVTSTEEHVTS